MSQIPYVSCLNLNSGFKQKSVWASV